MGCQILISFFTLTICRLNRICAIIRNTLRLNKVYSGNKIQEVQCHWECMNKKFTRNENTFLNTDKVVSLYDGFAFTIS